MKNSRPKFFRKRSLINRKQSWIKLSACQAVFKIHIYCRRIDRISCGYHAQKKRHVTLTI